MIKDYLKQFGIDIDQTFIAIVKPMAFRIFFVIAIDYNLDINQIDVNTVFFYNLVDQLIYIKLSKGIEIKAKKNMVYKLLKVLYGLK